MTTARPASPPTNPDNMSPAIQAPPEVVEKKKPEWRIPLLRLRVNDVSSTGSAAFFSNINATTLLREAVIGVLERLYTPATAPPNVRSVTLVLRSMGGIAYTTGSELDDDHKEIHFSTDYVGGLSAERVKHEILGVVRHEMVHCWQYNGLGTCPGGLVEGIADFVRLKDGLAPPNWSRGGKKWDEGYQVTAYFLEWCEQKIGAGFVKRLNGRLKNEKYSPNVWKSLTGSSVDELWKQYQEQLGNRGQDGAEDSDDDENGVHTGVKGESSEDGSVDVVRREEANEDGSEDNKLSLDHESTGDWLPEEKEALFLRHRLQRTFLPPNDDKPNTSEFPDADTYFTFLESMEDVPASILQKSKLPKVLKFISRIEDPNVVESQYNFTGRARALVDKWGATLPKLAGAESPTSPIRQFETKEELIKTQEAEWREFFSELNPALRRALLLDLSEPFLRKMPVEYQSEANAYRIQIQLPPRPIDYDPYDTSDKAALVQLAKLSATYDGASDTSASEDETEYEQSYVSTTHESTAVSCASSMAETDSQTSETILSHSRGSPSRGVGGHEINTGHRVPPNDLHDVELSSASSSSTSTWHSPSNDSHISLIARKKLASLKFLGDLDGARFIKEFEKLVDRVQPDMSDDDKRVLLTTSFTGQTVNVWYEELDVDDSMPYEELRVAFIDKFKGMSRRSKKLDGGALLDL